MSSIKCRVCHERRALMRGTLCRRCYHEVHGLEAPAPLTPHGQAVYGSRPVQHVTFVDRPARFVTIEGVEYEITYDGAVHP